MPSSSCLVPCSISLPDHVLHCCQVLKLLPAPSDVFAWRMPETCLSFADDWTLRGVKVPHSHRAFAEQAHLWWSRWDINLLNKTPPPFPLVFLCFSSLSLYFTSVYLPLNSLLPFGLHSFSSRLLYSYLSLFPPPCPFPSLPPSQSNFSVCRWCSCECVVYMQCSVFSSLWESQCSTYHFHNALPGDDPDYAKCACVFVMFFNKS